MVQVGTRRSGPDDMFEDHRDDVLRKTVEIESFRAANRSVRVFELDIGTLWEVIVGTILGIRDRG